MPVARNTWQPSLTLKPASAVRRAPAHHAIGIDTVHRLVGEHAGLAKLGSNSARTARYPSKLPRRRRLMSSYRPNGRGKRVSPWTGTSRSRRPDGSLKTVKALIWKSG